MDPVVLSFGDIALRLGLALALLLGGRSVERAVASTFGRARDAVAGDDQTAPGP